MGLRNRRGFLAASAAGVLGTRLFARAAGATLDQLGARAQAATPAALAQDEEFWLEVRERFELDPDWIVLATVVRGAITREVRERVEAEAARLHALRPRTTSDPDWRARVRAKAAALVGAGAERVALTRNTTEGVTTVLLHWPLRSGDEILTSSGEHGHYYGTLAIRAARDGVRTRTFHLPTPARSAGDLVDAVEQALGPRTRLVMLCRVTLTGQILPIRDIAERVHARGARLLVDGALSVGHVVDDVESWGCDFYAGNFHKWSSGPRGTGIFWVKSELVERLLPLYGSVTQQGRRVPRHGAATMEKFEELGGHPTAHFYGLEAALDLLSTIGVDRIQARLYELTRYWTSELADLPGLRLAVRVDPSLAASLVAWEIAGTSSEELTGRLRRHRIVVGGSDLYDGFFGIPEDQPRWLTLTNTAIFTTRAELDRFAAAVRRETANG